MVPEFVVVRAPDVAWICVLPAEWPVNIALFESPLGTRSPETIPPVVLCNDHELAATLATKLLDASRVIAYAVREFPAGRLWEGTIVPLPSTAVSTRTCDGVPAITEIVPDGVRVSPP